MPTIIDIIEYSLLTTAGILFLVFFTRDSRVRFVSIFFTIIILSLKSEHHTFSLLDYCAAALFSGSFLFLIVKRKFIERQQIIPDPLYIFYSVFLVWGTVIGLAGVGTGAISAEKWYRDVLLFISPLFLLPAFFDEMRRENRDRDKILWFCFLCLWLIMFTAEVVKIRSNVMSAFYAYEIGQARFDNFNGAFMCFVFLSLSMITTGKKRLLLLLGLVISLGSLFLTFSRAVWVFTIVLTPVMFYFADRTERKRGIQFCFMVVVTLVPLFLMAFFFIRLVHISVLMGVEKFLSSSHLKTDLSMYNRYVEWRYELKSIVLFPFTGQGFGAQFWDYDWLKGVSFETPYTHNAFFAIMLRTGVIGVILLLIPFVGYIIRGIRYVKNKSLTRRERAYLRAAVATIILIAGGGYTGSLFLQRDMTIYIASYWCFIAGIENKIQTRNVYYEQA